MTALCQAVAILSAALFTGGALYISMVEHPARMRAGLSVALAEFRQMYPLAAPWQASAAILSVVSGVGSTLLTREWVWAVGGLVVGLVVPYTLLGMMAVNRPLLEPRAPRDEVAAGLLARWGERHWVRSILGAIGLVILVGAAVHR